MLKDLTSGSVFVIFPAIAQSQVNAATLNITSMALSDPTPNSFILNQAATIQSKSPFHPHLAAMNLSLFNEDTEPNIKPYMKVSVDGLTAKKTTAITVKDQKVDIIDLDEYTKFASTVMNSEHFRVALRSRTLLKLAFLKHTVDFNSVVTLPGEFSN
jgi:Protein of unknown function (DUF3712)